MAGLGDVARLGPRKIFERARLETGTTLPWRPASVPGETISAAFTSFRLDEWASLWWNATVAGFLVSKFPGDVTQRELIEEDA